MTVYRTILIVSLYVPQDHEIKNDYYPKESDKFHYNQSINPFLSFTLSLEISTRPPLVVQSLQIINDADKINILSNRWGKI